MGKRKNENTNESNTDNGVSANKRNKLSNETTNKEIISPEIITDANLVQNKLKDGLKEEAYSIMTQAILPKMNNQLQNGLKIEERLEFLDKLSDIFDQKLEFDFQEFKSKLSSLLIDPTDKNIEKNCLIVEKITKIDIDNGLNCFEQSVASLLTSENCSSIVINGDINVINALITILFKLEKQLLLELLTNTIINEMGQAKLSELIKSFVKCHQEMIQNQTIRRIYQHRYDYLVVNEEIRSWTMPNATCSIREIQEFLRGEQKSFSYGQFSSVKEAKNWIKDCIKKGILSELTDDYSISLNTTGKGKQTRISIVKTIDYFDLINPSRFVEKLEKFELSKLLNPLQAFFQFVHHFFM